MNSKQALARLRKVLGPKAGYRIRNDSPDADERARLTAEIPGKLAERNAAREALEARRKELLMDPLYLSLVERYRKLQHESAEMVGRNNLARITVGRVNSLFFTVAAQGETWNEVFEKLKEKG